jgi:hypothetical protein
MAAASELTPLAVGVVAATAPGDSMALLTVVLAPPGR